jgi:NAD+ kinase
MKLSIFSFSSPERIEELAKLVLSKGFEIADRDPDAIIAFGGDGTLMRAEHDLPGVPKLMLRDSRICKLCSPLENGEILDRLAKGEYGLEKVWKLEARAGERTLLALNDIVLHNQDPRHAIRYALSVRGRRIAGEIVGDGVVIATPLGSTAYYRSITDSFFEVGIGIAFNNSTEQSDHMVVREDSLIELRVARGPAFVYGDNNPESIELSEGGELAVQKSSEYATIIRA